MDKEFVYLAVVCTITLLLGLAWFVGTLDISVESENEWQICTSEGNLTNAQERDCKLFELLTKDVNSDG